MSNLVSGIADYLKVTIIRPICQCEFLYIAQKEGLERRSPVRAPPAILRKRARISISWKTALFFNKPLKISLPCGIIFYSFLNGAKNCALLVYPFNALHLPSSRSAPPPARGWTRLTWADRNKAKGTRNGPRNAPRKTDVRLSRAQPGRIRRNLLKTPCLAA